MKVKELLSNPERWTQGYYYRYKDNHDIPYRSGEETPDDNMRLEAISKIPDNFCFCLLGALEVCYRDWEEFREARYKLSNALLMKEGDGRIPSFNDDPNTTHEKIMELLNEVDV